MTPTEVLRLLRQRVSRFKTQVEAADSLGIQPQYLSDILKGRRDPGPKVLKSLGLTRETHYVRRAK